MMQGLITNFHKFFIRPIWALDISIGHIDGTGVFMRTIPDRATLKARMGLYLTTFVTALTVIAGLAFLGNFIIGALGMILSGGDKTKLAEATSRMTNAFLGLVIVVVAYFVLGLIGRVLGLDILNPGRLLGL